MRAVHFSAIWLGITTRVPDSFQTLCEHCKLFPFAPPRASQSTGDLPFVTERGGLARAVTTFLQIADHLVAFMRPPPWKGAPWTGTMSGITLLIVAPELEVLFFHPNTCPQIRQVWKSMLMIGLKDSAQHRSCLTSWTLASGWIARRSIYYAIDEWLRGGGYKFYMFQYFGVPNWIEIHK